MKALILLLTLTSCGTESNAPAGGGETKSESTKPDNVKHGKNNSIAYMVNDDASRPTCEFKEQLIYVISKKEFQACDGSNWVAVSVTNNTTTNNTYTAQNTYTDTINQNEWLILNPVQRSKIQTLCPTGFSIATKAQVDFIRVNSELLNNHQALYPNVAQYYWSKENELGRSGIWFNNPAIQLTPYRQDGHAMICVK